MQHAMKKVGSRHACHRGRGRFAVRNAMRCLNLPSILQQQEQQQGHRTRTSYRVLTHRPPKKLIVPQAATTKKNHRKNAEYVCCKDDMQTASAKTKTSPPLPLSPPSRLEPTGLTNHFSSQPRYAMMCSNLPSMLQQQQGHRP